MEREREGGRVGRRERESDTGTLGNFIIKKHLHYL